MQTLLFAVLDLNTEKDADYAAPTTDVQSNNKVLGASVSTWIETYAAPFILNVLNYSKIRL